MAKLARVLAASDPEDAYQALTTHWPNSRSVVLGAEPLDTAQERRISPVQGAGITEQMLWLDLVGYLPDDILAKVDRAAMAVSLETRVPFLDRRVLDLAWGLPLDAKLRGGQNQMAVAPGARPSCAGRPGGPAEDGVRLAHRVLVTGGARSLG